MKNFIILCWTMCSMVAIHAQTPAKIVDLRNTPGGKQVASILGKLAQGNEGEGRLESLTLNLQTGEITGRGVVRHKHVWKYGPNWAPQTQTVYDWTWNGSFSFNAKTGAGHAEVDVGRGFKFHTRDIERALAGDVKPLLQNALPNGGLVEKKFRNEYSSVKQGLEKQYGAGNVYFASSRFVNWATPETAGDWVIRAVVTGGVDASRIMAEVTRQAQLELNDLSMWLQARGVKEAHTIAANVLAGKPVQIPELTLRWVTVGYFSQNVAAGQPVGPEIRVTHAAFALTWKPQPVPVGPVDIRNSGAARDALELLNHKLRHKDGSAVWKQLSYDKVTGQIRGTLQVVFKREGSKDVVIDMGKTPPSKNQELKLGRGVDVDALDLWFKLTYGSK